MRRRCSRMHFNPRSPDGERPGSDARRRLGEDISIHAPRMGSDKRIRRRMPKPTYFNPRSPDGERLPYDSENRQCAYFNPRSPDGERQAPPTRPTRKHQHFNPRSPDGERQCLVYGEFANHEISIHAPRMGSDSGSSKADSGSRHFNPRSPDGERLVFGASARTAVIFQSTLPGWGATSKFCMSVWFCEISIHAPRMGSDRCGRLRTLREPRISIHAPRMGSDHLTGVSGRTTADFNPRSPDGERPRKWTSSPTIWAKSSIFNTDCIADRR